MSMNIGRMDRRITLERQSETVTASGNVVKEWTTLAVVWAEIVQQTAHESPMQYGEAETGSVVFRLRYFPDLTTADRVTYDGQSYGLKDIKEIGRRTALELEATVIR